MATINLQQKYTVPRDELKAKLQQLADEMVARYQLNCRWDNDDCLSFKRSGASGEIVIKEDALVFTMKLGMLLGAFKTSIEKEVQQFMDEHIH